MVLPMCYKCLALLEKAWNPETKHHQIFCSWNYVYFWKEMAIHNFSLLDREHRSCFLERLRSAGRIQTAQPSLLEASGGAEILFLDWLLSLLSGSDSFTRVDNWTSARRTWPYSCSPLSPPCKFISPSSWALLLGDTYSLLASRLSAWPSSHIQSWLQGTNPTTGFKVASEKSPFRTLY